MRKLLFWLHLSAGCLAGAVILLMSVTGVLLTYQRQIIRWADRGYRVQPGPGVGRMEPEALLAAAAQARGAGATALILRSAADEPARVEFGRDAGLYLNPYTGAVLGEGAQGVRDFFHATEAWHRWLAAQGDSRTFARGITGAANLVFLGLVLTGVVLWIPRAFSRAAFRAITWFRAGLTGRSRDWNWHNTIGIWSVVPLLVIVASGAVMSYPWANDLVFQMAGDKAPARTAKPAGAALKPAGAAPVKVPEGLNRMWQRAQVQTPDWTIITFRPSAQFQGAQFQIDTGDGGQPQRRGQLTFKSANAEPRWEPYESQAAGRRARSWLRFAHTGEVYGIAGQTVAGLASAGGVVLVWTGMALAFRRLAQALRRSRVQLVEGLALESASLISSRSARSRSRTAASFDAIR